MRAALEKEIQTWIDQAIERGETVPDFWDETNTSERLADHLAAFLASAPPTPTGAEIDDATVRHISGIAFERAVRSWKDRPENRYADLNWNEIIFLTCREFARRLPRPDMV